MKTKAYKQLLLALWCVFFVNSQASANNIYAIYDDNRFLLSNGFSVRDASMLNTQINFFDVSREAITGVSFANNKLYITAGNKILEYSKQGILNSRFVFNEYKVDYLDVTTANGFVFATYTGIGAFYKNSIDHGVTVREINNLSNQIRYFNIGSSAATGIIAGKNNDLFITAGNTIQRYNFEGRLLDRFQWGSNIISYTDATFVNGLLVASYTGPIFKGVTIRDPNNLNNQIFSFDITDLGFNPTGITAGNNNDFFITSADNIYQYDMTGNLLSKFSFGSRLVTYKDIAVNPVPEPEVLSLLLLGLGLISFARCRNPDFSRIA